jgi:hypothetical protein
VDGLSWANGDRTVYNEYRSLRDEVKRRDQQIARHPRAVRAVLAELDQVIADNFEQDNPDYRGIVIEQREFRRKRNVCSDALTVVLRTHKNIRSVSASLHVEPKGRTADLGRS